jgi:protein TonB
VATEPVLPHSPWSAATSWRERRAAALALGLSLAVHLAALALLPDWRASAPPPTLPSIEVSLLPPPSEAAPPPPPSPAAAPSVPAPAPRARPAAARPAVVARQDASPAAPRVNPAAPAPAPAPEAAPGAETSAPLAIAPPAPPLAPAASVASAAQAADPALLARYGQTLSDLLARQQQYPRLAAVRGWEGEVVLKLVIARKGQLVTARVVRSSGHAVLDEHALALVAEAQPFPALPGPSAGDDLELTVPVHYHLNKKS